MRFFNTTGPCNPQDHYMLPPEERLIGAQLNRYIKDKLYWVLYAPRQTGKTTFLQSWMRKINSGSEALACYVTVERCRGIESRNEALPAVCDAICDGARDANLPVPEKPHCVASSMVVSILRNLARTLASKPLVVLFDETDHFSEDPMISFLTQLRSGFMERGAGTFPVSVSLVGVRDLKDYLTQAKGGIPPNIGSVFNLKEEIWEEISGYTEVFPHLLLMAFLQRVLNGGGYINREYAAGRGRIDLFIEYNKRKYIIEIKLIHDYDKPEKVLEHGLEQIKLYRDRVSPGAPSYLVIFDRRACAKEKIWGERISRELLDNGIMVVKC